MADVGCAGILVADTFCGPMEALPVAGQLLALDAMPARAGGCAVNVAIDLAKQGISVDAAGCVGTDAEAEVVLDGLAQYGVDSSRLTRTTDFRTSKTVILIVEGEDRRYLHMFGANRAFTAASLDREWLKSLKVFYLGGLFALTGVDLPELAGALRFCRENGVITVVDVVLPHTFTERDELNSLLPDVDYFVPNDDEALLITGVDNPKEQLRMLQASGAGSVVITQGNGGAVAAASDGSLWQSGVFPAQTVDPSGSGDAFASGIITGIVRGWDMPTCLRYASALGASATRAVGTTDGVFTAHEAEKFVSEHALDVKPLD